MDTFKTLTYEVTGRIARITLNRPERGNGITLEMPAELAACVERANLDPTVHVIALAGNGNGFCGGYDLVVTAEQRLGLEQGLTSWPSGSPMDLKVQLANHDPDETWDPMLDYAMMSRNVRGFMSLFHSDKPVICKVHGFCVAGGTDMALCSDLLLIEDEAAIGYPPARVWGARRPRFGPTGSEWRKPNGYYLPATALPERRQLNGVSATEAPTAEQLDTQFERLLERVARLPVNQLVMMKLLINQTLLGQGLNSAQLLGTMFDGIARHTKEGYAFQKRAAEVGFKQAVKERDAPFADQLVHLK